MAIGHVTGDMTDEPPPSLTHLPQTVRKYVMHGETGVTDIATELEEEARQQPEGKFSKRDTYYIPQSVLPPFFWSKRCGRCRFWHEGGPAEPGRCHIVGRTDDPYGGDAIHPNGVCALYTPPRDEPAFGWLWDRLHPNGATSVRGEYNPPLTLKRTMRHRRRHTEGEVAEQAEKGHAPATSEQDDPSTNDQNDD